jgi:Domain of Unknown Function (DUF1080)
MVEGQGTPTLTPEERAAGWKLLFDGKSLAGWRGFKTETPSAGWKAVDGVLFRAAGGGDLLTTEQFGDFELSLEWKLEKGGNSGIFFRVIDEGDFGWWSGPEVQVLDNAVHKDGKNLLTSAGSNYAVHAPLKDVTKPIGEWNAVRLVVKGAHVEHWLNGVKIIEYELGSAAMKAGKAKSKFKDVPGWEDKLKGHILLQDHGDDVSFFSIKIRELPAKSSTSKQ